MELFIFARFRAREEEAVVAVALRDAIGPSRAEPGCREIAAYRSVQDPRLFWIHSRWINEAAFDVHAEQLHIRHFVERVQQLVDHPLEVSRSLPI